MAEIENNSAAIEKLDFEAIKNMEYLNAVVKEGLRLVSLAVDVFPRSLLKIIN